MNNISLLNTLVTVFGSSGGPYLNDLDALNAIVAGLGGSTTYLNTVDALRAIYFLASGSTTDKEDDLSILNLILGYYSLSSADNVPDALALLAGAEIGGGLTLNAIYILCDNEKVYRTNQALTEDWQEIATTNTSATSDDDFAVTPDESFVVFANTGTDTRVWDGSTWTTVNSSNRSIALDTLNEKLFISYNGTIRRGDYNEVNPSQWRGADTLPSGICFDPVNQRVYWLEYIQDDYVRIDLDQQNYTRVELGFEFGDFNQIGRADPEHGYIYFIEENTSGADHVYRLTIADNSFQELLGGNYSVANQAFAPLRVTNEVAVAQVGGETTLTIIDNDTLLPDRTKEAPANIVAIFISFTEAQVE